jgi:hypothetical protein
MRDVYYIQREIPGYCSMVEGKYVNVKEYVYWAGGIKKEMSYRWVGDYSSARGYSRYINALIAIKHLKRDGSIFENDIVTVIKVEK